MKKRRPTRIHRQAETLAEILERLAYLRGWLQPIECLTATPKKAAELLGISEGHFLNLHSQGKVPKPVWLGGRRVWVISDLVEWMKAGAPEGWESPKRRNQ